MSLNYRYSTCLQKSPNTINLRKNLPMIYNSNYMKLIEKIKHKIWLHNNKKEFFNKTSIIYYLNKISNIETSNSEIILTKEKYKKLLQGTMKEIEGFENTAYIKKNMPLNLNISQDIKRLKDTRQSENVKSNDENLNQYIKLYSFDRNDSSTNISQISLTNDDFQYSDLHASCEKRSDNINETTNSFVNNVSISKIFELHPTSSQTTRMNPQGCNVNEFQNFTKEMITQENNIGSIRNSDLDVNQSLSSIADWSCLNSITTLGRNIVEDSFKDYDKNSETLLTQRNNQHSDTKGFNEFQKPSSSSKTTTMNIQNAAPALKNIPNIYKEGHVDSGISSMTSISCDDGNKISKKRKIFYNEDTSKAAHPENYVCEIEENPFNNQEVAEQRLTELNSMINVFKTCVLENIDNIVAKRNERQRIAEGNKEPVKVTPFCFNKNNPGPLSQPEETNETNLSENNITCEQLSFIYNKKYNELLDSTESASEIYHHY